MADTLSETKACDLLTRLFRGRGYTIVRNVLFREYGVEFHVDGWDAGARVGFEFLSSEDEDHIDLSLEEYQTLADAQRRGELALFIIDEVEPLSAAELAAEATDFLDEVAAAAKSRRTPRRSRAQAAGGGGGRRAAVETSTGGRRRGASSTKRSSKSGKKAVKKGPRVSKKKAAKGRPVKRVRRAKGR